MALITILATNGGVPLVSAGTVPTIRIRRLDTNALVETDSNMTEVGDGVYKFDLTAVSTLEYSYRADADPGGSDGVDGQVTVTERYFSGAVSGIQDERIEVDIPAIPTNVWAFDVRGVTGTTFDTAAKALNSVRIIEYNTLKPTVLGAGASMSVFEDDGVTQKAAFAILDVNDLGVTSVTGAAANRGAGT